MPLLSRTGPARLFHINIAYILQSKMLLQCKYPCFSQTFIEKEANGNNVNVFNNTFFLLSYGFMGKEGVPQSFKYTLPVLFSKDTLKLGSTEERMTFIRNDARLEKF